MTKKYNIFHYYISVEEDRKMSTKMYSLLKTNRNDDEQ